MENPIIKMDDLGVPLFSETPICWLKKSSPRHDNQKNTQNYHYYSLAFLVETWGWVHYHSLGLLSMELGNHF